MKVVVWNVANKLGNWDALAERPELKPDIGILSEAPPAPDGVTAVGHGRTIGLDCEHENELECEARSWSTAVVSPRELREIHDARRSRAGKRLPFKPSRPGTWTAAVVSVPEVGEVTAISLYGLLDEKSDASVHRSLSELSPIFDHKRYKRLLLLGGDLNMWKGMNRIGGPRLDRGRVALERITAYGLIDCLEKMRPSGTGPLEGCQCHLGPDCKHTWTKLDTNWPAKRYQDDYLFASKALADRLTDCRALSPIEWQSYSDHSPIVATFQD